MASDGGSPVPPPGRTRTRAVLAGVGVAAAGSVLWGLAAAAVRHQFSVLAVAIGLATGMVMARSRPGDKTLAIPAAIAAVAGCALGSLAAEVMIALRDGIPAALLLGHPGLVLRAYPATVGWLGLLFWALAAAAGFAAARGGTRRWARHQPAPQAISAAIDEKERPAT